MEAPLLTIEGKDYIFVKTRSHMPVSIYKGDGCYLRIGPPELIQGEIDYHRSLLEFGFPIPTILTIGEHLGYGYFIESSLGEEHFGEIFARTCTRDCIVYDTEFEKLLAIVEKFLSAQLKTVNLKPSTPELFRRLIQLDTVIEELPELETSTREAMARIENRIQSLPSVLTHGDFNPFNILEGGVIDWERGSYTPLGYDLTSNITQTFFFPLGGDFEYTTSYRYSSEQIIKYWKRLDAICAEAGIVSISDYRNDFILCRCMWSLVRMQRWPKLQAWRNELYKKLLEAYLNDEDLTELLRTY